MGKKMTTISSRALDRKFSRAVSAEERHRMIAEAAYYRAEHRGFAGGNVEDDWFQAEREIDHGLLGVAASAPVHMPTRPAPSERAVILRDRG